MHCILIRNKNSTPIENFITTYNTVRENGCNELPKAMR